MKSLRALGTVARVKGLGLAVALRLPQCFLSEDGTALGATSETHSTQLRTLCNFSFWGLEKI